MTQWTTLDRGPAEPDEAAYPEPPGGGIAVALLGGLAASGSVFLVFAPPLVLVWLAVVTILTGASTRRGVHFVTATVGAIAPAIATFFAAQCLTGVWGWMMAGLVLFTALLLVGTPAGFGIGRLLRSRLAGWYFAIRSIVIMTGVLSAIAWGLVIGSALMPGECPTPP